MEKVYITLERYKALRTEVRELKTKQRRVIADKLSEYRDSVDLVEDSSYNDIIHEQANLEEKIEELEVLLENACIIKERKSAKIRIGSTVVLRKVGDRKSMMLKLVGSFDANPLINHVSNESPLGQALLGKKKDDEVLIETPTITNKYKIIDVK